MDESLKKELREFMKSEIIPIIRAEIKKFSPKSDKKNPYLYSPTQMARLLNCSITTVFNRINKRKAIAKFRSSETKKVLYDIREVVSADELSLLNLNGGE